MRLSLNAVDGVMAVQIVAERADTLDLIRRNLDLLAQELRGIGYADMRFALGDTGGQATSDPQAGTEDAKAAVDHAEGPDTDGTVPSITLQPISGLDLRL